MQSAFLSRLYSFNRNQLRTFNCTITAIVLQKSNRIFVCQSIYQNVKSVDSVESSRS